MAAYSLDTVFACEELMKMDDDDLQTSRCDTRWSQQLSGLPQKLLQGLMPFQRKGVKFALSKNGRCMIADEMGLGKTVQAIAVACAFRQEWPFLIVAPASMKYHWIEELERWIPELQPGDINLVKNKRHTMGFSSSKVTVLSYGLLTSNATLLVDALTRQKFAVVVVDESHYLKCRKAMRTKIMVPLIRSAKRAILLTGTPALGRPEELFTQIDALYPKRFGTWTEFAVKFCNAHYRYFGCHRVWDCRGASNLTELHQQLSQIMIRRLKANVLSQLPPKIRQRIAFDLPKKAAKKASASLAKWERLMKGRGSNRPTEVLELVAQMYQETAIAKVGAVKDYIKAMLEAEQLKFLVFAHHHTMLQACTEAVIEAKASYIRIDGKVPPSERIQLVHKFQSDPKIRVAVLSIQAAGQGLTFTAASHVVFAELYWNPGHIKQAEDRAHRIGQTSSINVHYLIANGTFDAVMWSMINKKVRVTNSTLDGKKEYLKADEDDEDKWMFLNFASAWTPSEMVVPPDGNTKKKKRKRTEDEGTDPPISSELTAAPAGSGTKREKRREKSCTQTSTSPGQDISPQLKWLRGRSGAGRTGSGSQVTSMVPRKSKLIHWTSAAMSERPRPQQTPSTSRDLVCIAISSSDSREPELSLGKAQPLKPRKGKQIDGEEKKKGDKRQLKGKQIDGEEKKKGDKRQLKGKQIDGEEKKKGDKRRLKGNTGSGECSTHDGTPLNLSFIPLDIKLSSWDDLPQAFSRHQENRTQVLRFVQEWSSLAAMKKKLLRRSGLLFHSPALGLQQLATAQHPHLSTKRYLSRDDVAKASLRKAQQEGGSVRLVTKENFFTKSSSASAQTPPSSERQDEESCQAVEEQPSTQSGYLQAVDSEGVPLCLSCQKACLTTGGTWDTQFCSHRCQEDFQLRSSQSYMRSKVLEVERGICQTCGLHAHDLFLKVCGAQPSQRKQMLENTCLAQLSLKELNEMIRAPVEGDFWQVDHIRPVYSGGGQCSLDNLQTLCTVCHRERTAQQAKERSRMRKRVSASKVASDITKFFIRK